MDTKTITGVGIGALLLGGVAFASRDRRMPVKKLVVGDSSRFVRLRFIDQMRAAGTIAGRAKSRNDFLRAKMHLERAYENLLLMRAFEGERPDHDRYFDEWDDAVTRLEHERTERGMRPLPI